MPNWKERCSHCVNLIEVEKKWYCCEIEEPCDQIVWCPYFDGMY